LLGIWRAGGVAVPLAVSYPAAELEYVIRDSAAEIVIADSSASGMLLPIAASAGVTCATSGVLLSAPPRGDVPGGSVAAGSRRASTRNQHGIVSRLERLPSSARFPRSIID